MKKILYLLLNWEQLWNRTHRKSSRVQLQPHRGVNQLVHTGRGLGPLGARGHGVDLDLQLLDLLVIGVAVGGGPGGLLGLVEVRPRVIDRVRGRHGLEAVLVVVLGGGSLAAPPLLAIAPDVFMIILRVIFRLRRLLPLFGLPPVLEETWNTNRINQEFAISAS